MNSAYRDFVKRIGLRIGGNPATAPDPIIKNAVQQWLSNPVSRGSTIPWLLVMDSANDIHVVSEYWPHNGEGCLLLTTRQPAIGSTFSTIKIEVGSLAFREAAEMLLNLTRRRNEPAAASHAMKIAEFWEGIPACMELVNVVIRSQDLSLAEFAAIQNTRKTDYLRQVPLPGLMKPFSVSGFLPQLAVDMKARHEGEIALLLVLSFLDGSCIREQIVTEHPQVARLAEFPKDTNAYFGCRTRLWETSMIKYDSRLHELRVSGIVQDTLLSRTGKSDDRLTDGFTTAAALIVSVWPCNITIDTSFSQLHTSERWNQCRPLMPHINQLWSRYLKMDEVQQRKCATRSFAQLLAEAAW